MTRTNFRGSGPPTRSWTLTADATHTIELFVRHVPLSQSTENPTPEDDLKEGESATHFNAFFSLLKPEPTIGTLPQFGRKLGTVCYWPVTKTRFSLFDTAGTMSCMVGAGDPP